MLIINMGKNKEKTYQEYARDLGYEVEDWSPSVGACPIFKASRDGLLVTVKFGNSSYKWGYDHVITENKVLDRMRGVEGIVEKKSFHELEHVLEHERLVALVRHYIEGEGINDHEGGFDGNVLINAVNALHENGIARLDLWETNIIIGLTGKPYLIDLGHCVFSEDGHLFRRGKQSDLGSLECMLKTYGG